MIQWDSYTRQNEKTTIDGWLIPIRAKNRISFVRLK